MNSNASTAALAARTFSMKANPFTHLAVAARLAMTASLALLAADASAQSFDDARAAYGEGRFLDAAEHGEALGTSEGYALAARSLSIYAHYVATDGERKEIIDRAIRVAEEAVRADSANPEGLYQAAHAYGRFAQHNGKMTVLRKGTMGRSATCWRPRSPWTRASPMRFWPWAAGTPTSTTPDGWPGGCTGAVARRPSNYSSAPWK